jgi:hypothetical protein
MIVKTRTIAIVTLVALASTAYANAASYKHRHHHTAKMNATSGVTTGMARSGPSGPGIEPGARDKSRTGGEGVNDRPSD